MNSILYTIGYEGSDIAHFLLTLQQCGIKRVIDVREVPLSRKRGFSKTALAAKLVESGIDYSHFKALGDPKPGRDAMRSEEHTSELQSLMRISYAVFCLKKKTKTIQKRSISSQSNKMRKTDN